MPSWEPFFGTLRGQSGADGVSRMCQRRAELFEEERHTGDVGAGQHADELIAAATLEQIHDEVVTCVLPTLTLGRPFATPIGHQPPVQRSYPRIPATVARRERG